MDELYYDEYNYREGNIEIYENAEFRLSEHYIQETFTDKVVPISESHVITLDDFPVSDKFVDIGDRATSHVIGFILNVTAHLLIVTVTILLFTKSIRQGVRGTGMHACFCTVGFLFFLSEGMMVLFSGNVWSLSFDKDTKVVSHYLLCFIGSMLGLYGTVQKFVSKAQHFDTRHSRFGLVAALLIPLNVAFGVLTFITIAVRMSNNIYQIIHSSLGCICYVTAMMAMFYSCYSGFFYREIGYVLYYKILIILILVLVILGPFQQLVWMILLTYMQGEKEPVKIKLFDEEEEHLSKNTGLTYKNLKLIVDNNRKGQVQDQILDIAINP